MSHRAWDAGQARGIARTDEGLFHKALRPPARIARSRKADADRWSTYEGAMMLHFRLLLATFAVLVPFAAAAQTTLKMNISLAQNSHYGVAIDTFAREVEKRTNGRYRIQNFYSGAL